MSTPSLPPSLVSTRDTGSRAHVRLARTPLVDRDAEVASVVSLLEHDDVRLVTLTGPGGVGKTRVALAVASALAKDSGWRVTFVELADIRDNHSVVPTIAEALGLNPSQLVHPVEQFSRYVSTDRLILVLDNFEQVIGSAMSIAELLMACPGMKILVTSRFILRLSIEYDVPIAPLPLPEAMKLFVIHAQRSMPAFSLSAQNAPVVEEICSRLDGLPLAVELAAARVSVLPPAALLARLNRLLPLLTTGPRDQPTRLQTMRAAIAWSHDLLTDSEQVLFRRLAVFTGGFTLEAAEAVCGQATAESSGDHRLSSIDLVLDGIASLIDKSFVVQTSAPEGQGPRYRMLETVREFGVEQLAESGEELSIRAVHADFFCEHALQMRERVWSDESTVALARQDVEQDNVRAALDWTKTTGDADLGLRLAGAMTNFWIFRGHYREGSHWFAHWLREISEQPTPARSIALARLGWLEVLRGDVEAAQTVLRKAISDAKATRAQWPEALALLALGFSEIQRGDYVSASIWTAKSLELCCALEDDVSEASHFVTIAEAQLGQICLAKGDLIAAKAHLVRSMEQQRAQGFQWGLGDSLCRLGHVARRLGDLEHAAALYRESIDLAHAHGDPRMLVESIAGVAAVAVARGEFQPATRLFGVVASLRRQTTTLVKGWAPVDYETCLDLVRGALDPDFFTRCWLDGEHLSIADGVAEAIAACSPTAGCIGTAKLDDAIEQTKLTPREAEVLQWLARGLTDREIADALFLSPRTIGGYVTKILTELDLDSRTAAAVYAVRHSLASVILLSGAQNYLTALA